MLDSAAGGQHATILCRPLFKKITMLNFNLLKARAHLAVANDDRHSRESTHGRAFLLTAATLRLKELFTANAGMELFQITLIFQVEDTKEGDDRCVRIRQHLKIMAPNCPELSEKDGKIKFWTQDMPFWAMGAGSWTIARSHPLLQDLLQTPINCSKEQVCAYALALDLNEAFQAIRVDHFLGEIL